MLPILSQLKICSNDDNKYIHSFDKYLSGPYEPDSLWLLGNTVSSSICKKSHPCGVEGIVKKDQQNE